jgi:uncharacterized protein (UPF0548 family)
MFRLRRPTREEIDSAIAAARGSPALGGSLMPMDPEAGGAANRTGYDRDFSASELGSGGDAFAAAKLAFRRWAQFDLGWVRVANPGAKIEAGEVIAVEAYSLGLWSLNLSRIMESVDSIDRFGFVYSTTEFHVEGGEERFLLRMDPASGAVFYEVEALSRPRHSLARLGYPVTRAFQHQFARDSHRRMREAVSGAAKGSIS